MDLCGINLTAAEFVAGNRLEVPSLKLLGIILIISFGVMLTVAKETEFQLEGFILVMLSTVMAGFRWTVTQLLLQVYYDSCMTLKMMTLFIQEMETLLQKSGKYIFLQPLGSVICSRICFWFNING
jgi:ABC-type arginine transport system permease subunit